MIDKIARSTLLKLIQDISEYAQQGVVWLNEEGQIIQYTSKFIEDLGYDKNTFTLKSIYEFNPSTSILTWRKQWKKLLTEKKIQTNSEQINADEIIYPVSIQYVLIDSEDSPICMAIIENQMKSNRYKDLLSLTSKIGEIATWEWDIVNDDFIHTQELYDILDINSSQKINITDFKKALEELSSPDDYQKFKGCFEDSIANGTSLKIEMTLSVNNQFETYALNLSPTWLEDSTISICGTLQNISTISNRTDELYFKEFCVENANDMIFWIEENGTIAYANQAACNTLGYTKRELEGKHASILAQQEDFDWQKNWTSHWQELKEKQSLELEINHFTKSGESLPVAISANLIDYRGKQYNCGFVKNLKRKKEQDQLIKLAIESINKSADMVFWLNRESAFEYGNQSFLETTGYSSEELSKLEITAIFPNRSSDQIEETWKKFDEGQIIKNAERLMRTKKGNMIPVEVNVSMVEFEDKKFTTSILRDITERKQKEAATLVRLEKMLEDNKSTKDENQELRQQIQEETEAFEDIISKDPNYRKVLRQVGQVSDTDATVLILGETGTGKELLARAIHQLSPRSEKNLVKVNCGALPENLIESELFGHEKGSFTGAHQQKIGKFERANNGTIFLDEIGELPLDLQSKLLRVLQEGEIERVGGVKTLDISVRVIAATNRNLEQMVRDNTFREDLYYRLNVFPIYNIPLRERREDIPLLVNHFVKKYSKTMNKKITEITQSDLTKLKAYDFLGNVRELENIIERAIILSKNNTLIIDDILFQDKISKKQTIFLSLEDAQRKHIIEALKHCKGKISGAGGAAELLKINPKTLNSRIKKLSIDKAEYS